MKKALSLLCALLLLCALTVPTFAVEVPQPKTFEVLDTPIAINTENVDEDGISPLAAMEYGYRKTNVKISGEWSEYKRISDNLETRNFTGTISSDRSVTFGTVVTGNIGKLGINTSVSLTNKIGYTLEVGKYSNKYMAYRVYYEVETGVREFYDMVTGRVISRNDYIVKVPQYGAYTLLNA